MAVRRRKRRNEQLKIEKRFVDIKFEIDDENEIHEFAASVAYIEKGEGKPLIFVHGIGQSSFAWIKNIDFFAENGFHVYAIDLPGWGDSTHPNIYYTVEENAIMVKALMEALGIKRASVAGFSTGALSAVVLALDNPRMIDKLALVSPGGPNERYPFLMRLLTTGIGQLVFRMRFTPAGMESILKGRFFNKPLVSEEMVRLYYEPFKKKSVRDTLIMSLLHFEDSTGNSDLRSIRRDTIIFTGDNDDMHPKRDADVLTKKSGAKRVHLRNCGHFVNEEKADKFNSDMLRFLQK